jgi:hypothetical protein
MTHLLAFLFVCMASIALPGSAGQSGAAAADPDAIRQREQQRVKYLVSRDYDRLAEMTSPTLSYGHSGGAMDGKEKFIGDLRSGRVVFSRQDHRDVNVRFVSPDVAILTGLTDVEVSVAGQGSKFTLRITIVYVRKNGVWLFEAWHSSRQSA